MQINMKQTFTKYLPCARFYTTYTEKTKQNKTNQTQSLALVELTV